jgi:DNA-binding protein Fis
MSLFQAAVGNSGRGRDNNENSQGQWTHNVQSTSPLRDQDIVQQIKNFYDTLEQQPVKKLYTIKIDKIRVELLNDIPMTSRIKVKADEYLQRKKSPTPVKLIHPLTEWFYRIITKIQEAKSQGKDIVTLNNHCCYDDHCAPILYQKIILMYLIQASTTIPTTSM